MDGFQPTWRPGLHVYSHWHRAASSDLIAFLDVDVGFGSKSEVTARHVEVCFTPESGHAACILECPLSARSRPVRKKLVQEFQPLRSHLCIQRYYAREVAAWSAQAGDKSQFDWIARYVKHDWNRRGRRLGRECRGRATAG